MLPEAVRTIELSVGTDTVWSSVALPANARVVRADIDVTDAYSVGTTIEVGILGDPDLFLAAADSDPEAEDRYVSFLSTSVGSAAAAVLVTVGGAPATGEATVFIEFALPLG